MQQKRISENAGLEYHGSRRQAGQGNVTLTIDHHNAYVGRFLPQASAFLESMRNPNTILTTRRSNLADAWLTTSWSNQRSRNIPAYI